MKAHLHLRTAWNAVLGVTLLQAFPSLVQAAPPDLTAPGVIATIDRTATYNLGPTGLRGWIYIGGGSGADGTFTGESRQILVTVASTPGSAVLAVDDVILGAMAGSSGTVSLFSSDCRKAFGVAIGDAEKTGAGTLRVKRWRTGTTTDVNIPMTIMGNYTATAPYTCPKSALILANARNKLVGQLIANEPILTNDWAGAIHGLALLAGVPPGYVSPNNVTYNDVQARLRTYARSLAATTPNPSGLYVWDWGYIGLFLGEYYLRTVADGTPDANVVTGLNNYTVALAKVQSRYGTYNHGGSLLKADGSLHGTCPPYGPVNQAGIPANMAIVMGKKALLAASRAIDPEIDPAIQRGADFFAWFVNKGPIPYGEHEPYMENHSSNGKDAACAVLFGLQVNRPVETEYFSRMTTASFNAREDGHTGQGFNYLWGAMGANVGGPLAVAEYLKQIRWHLDLERRTDGSLVYDGQEGHGAGETAGNTYLGASSYYGLNPTASYILTYALPLQRLQITGNNAIPANTLDAAKVTHAIASATFKQDSPGFSTTQLIAALSDYDPVLRHYAAIELAKRSLTSTELTTLRGMLTGTNANGRMGACQTLGILKDATALPWITQRLDKNIESNSWVRAKAASALRSYTSAAASAQLTPMLTAFTANATDPEVIVWDDPIQISNRYLSLALFGNAVPDGSPGNNVAAYTKNASKNLLYPAVRAGLKQPDSYPRCGAAEFVYNHLSLADVQELALDIFEVITTKCQADPMWNYEPQLTGIKILLKYQCAEGLPMALSMLNVQEGWGWDSTTYLPPCMDALKTYGDSARWTLPTLNNDISVLRNNLADSDFATVHPQLLDTIASISSATTSPSGIITLLPVANPQVVTTTGTKAITLTGTSPRTAVTFTNVTAPVHGTLTGTAPNLIYTPTSGYTGPDHFTFQVTDNLTISAPGTVSVIVGTAGTGLKAEYFDNINFTNLKLTRTDAQVNFDWGTGSPDPLIGADTFSVRWSGLLLVPETGTYRFSTLNSDGVRLYVNGVTVIDDFVDQATHWKDGASVNLTAGQVVNLQMDYYENTGSAVAKLKWTGPSFAGANGLPIARDWLFDGASVPNPPTLTSFVDDKSGGPMLVNQTVTYTVTFSEPMNASTVDPTDFENASATPITVNSVTPTGNPAVFQVTVTPSAAGTLRLRVKAGATLKDLTGDDLITTSAIPDDTVIAVTTVIVPPTVIPVPNGSFELLYKPGSTTITADTNSGWTQGAGPNAAMEGDTATYSDTTTGTTVDVPGWLNAPAAGTPPNGGWLPPYDWSSGSGLVTRQGPTPYGTYYYAANGSDWGNSYGGAVQSAAALTTVASGMTYTISASFTDGVSGRVLDLLADGVALTPDYSANTPDANTPDGSWTLHTKTYGAASLAGSVGKALTIRVGWAVGATGEQSALDNVQLASITTNPPAAGYANWSSTHAPTGTAAADYDGDGVSNGVEYLLGGTKDTNDLGKLPKSSTTSGGDMVLTFERDQNSINSSTIVVIEVGTNLQTWTNSYAVPDVTTAAISGVSVAKNIPTGFDTVTLTIPRAEDTRKFARLKVAVSP